MGKVLIIDVSECVGCYCCQIVCKDEHVGNDWSPYAKPQPDTGHFWLKVDEMERGTIPKVKVTYTPILCMHCDNAPCIPACPDNAIVKREDGIVLIKPEKCSGCKLCLDACPYGVIYFNSELNIAQKCTLCAHLLDKGWSETRCVGACQREALILGEEGDPKIKSLIEKSEVLHPEYGTKPRVYYLNLPKPFIAGTIVDSSIRECVEGATVVALDLVEGVRHQTVSDEFGDFWLRDLKWMHRYLIEVSKEGYASKKVCVVHTAKDVNLGTITLTKLI
ncbi:MAG: 4Fe-4S dicluster domain-containing protein [Nitrososphaerales archaeon]